MSRYVIAVSGGRHYGERQGSGEDWHKRMLEEIHHVRHALDRIHAARPIDLLIEGGASGADRHAREWAEANRVFRATFFAPWPIGPQAGPMRTTLMLEVIRPSLFVRFPGDKGTAHAVAEATRLGIERKDA